MGKKYIPSGYQIISLDFTDVVKEIPFLPRTEDEKTLREILFKSQGKECIKPILVHIHTQTDYDIIQFATLYDGSLVIDCYGATAIRIYIEDNVDGTLQYEENEY